MTKSVLLSSDFLLLCMCKTHYGLLIMIDFIWRRLSEIRGFNTVRSF